ncbi:hypothetical protein BH24ACT26_BH24ACT26_11300 [soil metagenome]
MAQDAAAFTEDLSLRAVADRNESGNDPTLDFGAHLLRRAEEPGLSTLERAQHVASFARTLDGFYIQHVTRLKKLGDDDAGVSVHGLSPLGWSRLVAGRIRPFARRHAALFRDGLVPAWEAEGMRVVGWDGAGPTQRKRLNDLFSARIFPLVTPLAVDPGRPFPYISNLSLNLAVLLEGIGSQRTRFARVKVPRHLPRFVQLDEATFICVEAIIAANLDAVFPGAEVLEQHSFRVTRAADVDLLDVPAGASDRRGARGAGTPVRLEAAEEMPANVLDFLAGQLGLDAHEVIPLPGPLDLASVDTLGAAANALGRATSRR